MEERNERKRQVWGNGTADEEKNRDVACKGSSYEGLLGKNRREEKFSWGHETDRCRVEKRQVEVGKWRSWVKEEVSRRGAINPREHKVWARKSLAAEQENSWWLKGVKKKDTGEKEGGRESWDDEKERSDSGNQRARKENQSKAQTRDWVCVDWSFGRNDSWPTSTQTGWRQEIAEGRRGKEKIVK